MTKSSNPSIAIDEYINSLQPFAKKLCAKLRQVILSSSPGLQEEWKWGPHYSYKGMVCGYGGFQKHVKLTFFNGCEMSDPHNLFNHCTDNEFSRSIKYTDVQEVDEQVLVEYVKESMAVNEAGFKRVVKEKAVEVPLELTAALQANKIAEAFFNALTYGYKKEYAEYIATAKTEKTKQDRVAKVVTLCATQQKLNDKYKK